MLEETRQPDSVIRKVWFLADHYDIVFPSLNIILHEFLTILGQLLVLASLKTDPTYR
jgi:hypothetical protein